MDPSSFPKQYGGDLEWQWGDMPNLDEAAKEKLQGIEQTVDGKKDMMKGPMLFKGETIEVLGSQNGTDRRETIPVPKTEVTIDSSEKPTDDVAAPLASTENEKMGIDAVNVNQVDETQTQTTTAAA
jgi:hypothetical protein